MILLSAVVVYILGLMIGAYLHGRFDMSEEFSIYVVFWPIFLPAFIIIELIKRPTMFLLKSLERIYMIGKRHKNKGSLE